MDKKIWLSLFLLFVSLFFAYSTNKSGKATPHAQNVILLIGDGMGLSHAYAAYTVNNAKLNMFSMPVTGFNFTSSASNYITDSGAGGSAIATGKKTSNYAIAQDSLGVHLTSILEIAKKNKKATGLIATSSITHATPAAFYAHVDDRNKNDSIALFFLNGNVDVFVGGGLKHFANRSDKRNLLNELKKTGYSFCFSLDSIHRMNNTKVGCLLAPSHLPRYSEGRGNMLEAATYNTLQVLNQNPDGFFLMIEGSQIDWGGHANDLTYSNEETLDFDRAVGVALDFAAKNQNTLVIVTADHETGGMTIVGGSLPKAEINVHFSSLQHTATPVPVFTYGIGAENFTGCFENTALFYKMLNAFGLNFE